MFRNVIRFRVVWLRRKRDRSREFEFGSSLSADWGVRLNRLDVQMQNEYRNELRNMIDTRSTAQSTINLTFN